MSLIKGHFNVCVLTDGGTRLLFWCPGCKLVHGPTIGPGEGPRWTFNDDYEKPVFYPSLRVWWDEMSPEAAARSRAFRAEHGRYMTREEQPYDVHHECHSFIGHSGAQPGQIIFLSDCTHALAGQVVDLVPFRWDDDMTPKLAPAPKPPPRVLSKDEARVARRLLAVKLAEKRRRAA